MDAAPAGHLRVLVVDDQSHVRRWTKKVLTQLGITDVTECADGAEALGHLGSPDEHFDLIITDLRMPHQDGVELIRALAARHMTTAIILASIEPERVLDTSALLAEEQGVHVLGTISKPLTADKLRPLLAALDAPVHARAAARNISEDVLAAALPAGTLSLVYQPKIAMASGRFVGVEALARWKHEAFGTVGPETFVGVCESTPALGNWLLQFTLQEAMQFAARWNDGPDAVNVAVNVHAGAFSDIDLPDRIEALADDAGVPHDRITLELTERSVAEHAVRMLDVTTRLRLKHFGLAVDDFGTGHSSLSQLQRLPFNELKIDRSFVHGSSASRTKQSVVEASVSLARNLRITSVAEGIQQRPDWDLLQDLGCESMQGYFTARPMTEEALLAWAAQWNLHTRPPMLERQ